MKKRSKRVSVQQADHQFMSINLVSGLRARKWWTDRNGHVIFAIFGQVSEDLKSLTAADLQRDPIDLLLHTDILDELLKPATDLDLSAEVRYSIKTEFRKIAGLPESDNCDDVRLVQAGSECFVFVLSSVKDFQKTSKGYSWKWNN